jgi:hypothetical protein
MGRREKEPEPRNPDLDYSVERFYKRRDVKFRNGDEFKAAAIRYFKECEALGEPMSMNGLCLSIGTTRGSFWRWRRGREDLEPEIEFAKAIVEYGLEKRLITEKHVVGMIFNLVNNFGWQNVRIVEENVSIKSKRAVDYDPEDAESIRRAYEETFGVGQITPNLAESSTTRN